MPPEPVHRVRAFLGHPTVVVVAPLSASIAVSIAFLSRRNIYDDELSSFLLITRPLRELWHLANSGDVHPPGMYALSRLAWLAFGSERWMTIAPLAALYVGLTIYVVAALRALTRADATTRWFFAVGCYLHPQLLLWTSSIRWYPYWTALALSAVGLTLRSAAGESPPSARRSVVLGLIVGAMLYVGYLTFAFGAAFAVAFIVAFGASRRTMARLSLVLASAAALGAFQIVPFLTVHLAGAEEQRATPLLAAARLAHGLLWSEAFLPTHWIAAAAALAAAYLLVRARAGAPQDRTTRMHAAFVGAMCVIAVATGLGAKARSFLVLVPTTTFLVAAGWQRSGSAARAVAATIFVAWLAVGAEHLIARHGIAKSSLNDRPEEVVAYVNRVRAGAPAIVFTHDPGLTYALDRYAATQSAPVFTISTSPDALYPGFDRVPDDAGPLHVFVVRSYIGSARGTEPQLDQAQSEIARIVPLEPPVGLSKDDDAAQRRLFATVASDAADLPDDRFVVSHGYGASRDALAAPAASWRGRER